MNPSQSSSSLQRYPLPFPEYESAYTFDTNTGYFWSNRCGYYYDPKTKVYFDPVYQTYVKRRIHNSHEVSPSNSTLPTHQFEIWIPPVLNESLPVKSNSNLVLSPSLVTSSASTTTTVHTTTATAKHKLLNSSVSLLLPEELLSQGIITVCVPCSRGFRSETTLKRHEKESLLHQQNMQINQQTSMITKI